MVWLCRIKLFIHVHEIMTVRLDLGISCSDPIWYKKDDVNWASPSNWIIHVKKVVSRIIFNFARVFFSCWDLKIFIFVEILRRLHAKFWYISVKSEKASCSSFFSFIVILWVCFYPKHLQLPSMSPVAVQ